MSGVEPTGDLLALDPSIRSPGVALFSGGELRRAATLRIDADCLRCGLVVGPARGCQCDTPDYGPVIPRCLRVAQEVLAWMLPTVPRALAVEWPQWYARDKSKGDPNDLAGLSGVAGAVAGILHVLAAQRQQGLQVVGYKPAEWLGGQLPKSKTRTAAGNPRAERVLKRLTDLEICRMTDTGHDTVDAVGIGLHALGRLQPLRVFPGATAG